MLVVNGPGVYFHPIKYPRTNPMNDNPPQPFTDPEWENVFARAKPATPLAEILARIPIFSLLSRRELQKLVKIVHIRRFLAGETVVQRAVEQSGFYLIRSGSVHILYPRPGRQETISHTLGAGQLLGDYGLLDSTPRTTTAVAAAPSQLIGFFKPDLMNILVTNPIMGCKILLRLSEEMATSLARDYAALQRLEHPAGDQARLADDPTLS
ncbi:MAG: cyclic nucleotide-binding domain-containing protein [Candidatus Latescibacteria bacterium]|nr:cyclic nucleotide-binding domain-containing protein [Candidatus Latescibacterota bacterium]